jgi:dihydrofolate synthase/folylpolyglutamate synthase
LPAGPLEFLFSLQQFGIKLGLHKIQTILAALGHPERTFDAVHIAGTNGKGSVAAMTEAALRSAGHHTGRYTSPHLIELNERFAIDGKPVSNVTLVDGIEAVQQAVHHLMRDGTLISPPTFFEAATATAFELFRRASVEVAVCEVGMGGRLDATNVLVPQVSAITSIGFDHQEHLGATLAAIAREKAGIVKPGVPVVVGALPAEARSVILEVAARKDAPVIDAWSGAMVSRLDNPGRQAEAGRLSVQIKTERCDYGMATLALRGEHQIGNALVAVRVLESLARRGMNISAAAIVQGLMSAEWPGRLEQRQLADGRSLLMDAAHNRDGAIALATYLRATYAEPLPLVFAAMRDKDTEGMLQALAPVVKAIVATRASNERSADPAMLAPVVKSMVPSMAVEVHESVATALSAAWAMSPRIVVAGSIFLLGDVMKALRGS